MAAVIGSTQIQLKRTGSPATIPDNPTAKLMYYFNCICHCVEADNDSTICRLRNYGNYFRLSSEEEAQLLILCLALSPDKLIGSILFPVKDEDDLNGMSNDFFELSAVNTKLVVSESVLIGGQQKRVRKIMMFKKSWVEKYYLDPLRSIERQRPASRPSLPSPPRRPPPRRSNNSSCVIL